MKHFLIVLIFLGLSTNILAADTFYDDWIYGIPPDAPSSIIAFTEKNNAMFAIVCHKRELLLFTTIYNKSAIFFVKVMITNKTGKNPTWFTKNLITVNERFLATLKDGSSVYVTYPDRRKIKFSLYGSRKAIERLEDKCKEIQI